MHFSLSQVAEAVTGTKWLCDKDLNTAVSGVVIDSRKVEAGGVFIATKGERVDGHSFIPGVLQKGAVLVIGEYEKDELCSRFAIDPASLTNYICVQDSFVALKEIATVYRSTLDIPVVGITGSVGKTSTKEFVAKVLEQHYTVLKTEGNYNNEIGVPLTLLQIRPCHNAAVIEMGISDFGEMSRLTAMARPTICVITNIGQCHLENLKTRDGILQAKTEIFEGLCPGGDVVLNGDDDKLITLLQVHGKKPVFFGIENRAVDLVAENISLQGLLGSEATIRGSRVTIPVPGIHMVKNALCATAVGELLGLTPAQIQTGISNMQATKGRGVIRKLGGYVVIDECYNANPGSMKASIELLDMADGYRCAILGDMFELGENSDALHAEVGAFAAKQGLDLILFSGANSLHMYEAARTAATPAQTILYYPTREELLDAIKHTIVIPAGANILLKASHGMHYEEILAYFEGLG